MVKCCNPECYGEWFHEKCMKIQSPTAADWYCSLLCRKSDRYIYCSCQRHSNEDGFMIQCGKKSDCHRHEFYHPSCVFKSPEKRIKGKDLISCYIIYAVNLKPVLS